MNTIDGTLWACMYVQVGRAEGLTFTDYSPAKLPFGLQHPDPVVETASLAAVEPPDVTYKLHMEVRVHPCQFNASLHNPVTGASTRFGARPLCALGTLQLAHFEYATGADAEFI